jgi:endonuclease/exonuclease/phosphatase family metal-dependent hydrolase
MNELPWIVAGDLNSSVTFDKPRPRGNQEIQDRMSDLGFTECLNFHQGELTPTFKNPSNKQIVHQMDHLFVTEHLRSKLLSCTIGDADRVFTGSLSDHLPIIAEFNM